MSKRFTATTKWDKPWFRALTPVQKCLWDYICSKCDGAGVWEADLGLAAFQINAEVGLSDLNAFGDRLAKLPCGKILVRDFIEFQYGELKSTCKPHLHVLRLMEKHGAHYWNGNERVSIPFGNGNGSLEEKDPDKEQDTEREGDR